MGREIVLRPSHHITHAFDQSGDCHDCYCKSVLECHSCDLAIARFRNSQNSHPLLRGWSVCFSNPRFLWLRPERRLFLTSQRRFIIVRMHPLVRCDLARELDHMHATSGMTGILAQPQVSRSAYRVVAGHVQAGCCLGFAASMALDLYSRRQCPAWHRLSG